MCAKIIDDSEIQGPRPPFLPQPELGSTLEFPPFMDQTSRKILDESFKQDLLPQEGYNLLIKLGLSEDPISRKNFFQHLSRIKSESETFVKSKEWLGKNVEDPILRKELEDCVRLGVFPHLPILQKTVQTAENGPGGLGAYVFGQALQELVLQTKLDKKIVLNYFKTNENSLLSQEMILDLWSINGTLLLHNISEKIQNNTLKFEDDLYFKFYGVYVPAPR